MLCVCLWLWLSPVEGITSFNRDVCILGAGASGMYTATLLKDKNYSVIVLENTGSVGGHCNTIRFPGGWNDVGVIFYPDTKAANEAGQGNWTVDTKAVIQRFAGMNSLIPIDLAQFANRPTYAASFANPQWYGPVQPSPPSPAFLDAMNRYIQILTVEYPWLTFFQMPDRIPDDLLLPFDQWMVQRNLTALLPLFNSQLQTGGLGRYESMTTLWAVLDLSMLVLRLAQIPGSSYSVVNGCASIYEGMQAYLGTDNVLLNFQVVTSLRGGSGVRLTNENYEIICDHLVVSFPPLLENLSFMQLDGKERKVFQQVQGRQYFTSVLNVNGGSVVASPFLINNVNVSDPFLVPEYPSGILVGRGLAYGPASMLGVSPIPMTLSDVSALFQNQLDSFPADVIVANISEVLFHNYQPHPVNSALNHSNNFYTQLAKLQGHRNTYYVGSVQSYAATFYVWNDALKLVNSKF